MDYQANQLLSTSRRTSILPPTSPTKLEPLIGSSAHGLRKFQSHVYLLMGSLALFASGVAEVGKEEKEKRAYRFFKKALNGGPGDNKSVLATAVVAFFNEFGMGGLETDFREAERLYTEAAELGCGLAQARLAFLKTHGRPNIKISHSEAEHWRTACRLNSLPSPSTSTLTATSFSSSSSSSSATTTTEQPLPIRWLHLAAESNIPSAQFCLALCHYNGIAVPANDSLAFHWCSLAAHANHPGAQNVLGNLHIEGSGTPPNPTAGLRWYIRAAERKEAAAIYNIGTLFERGLAVEEDPVQAFEWYVRASVFGSVNAQNVLGIFHEQGIGVHQNPARAVYYYRTAALSGHPHAQYNLGRCYHDGFGVVADDSIAVMWFRLGADQGHALSLLSMAVCCEAGIGILPSIRTGRGETEGDKNKALMYYRKAAARDSFEAKRRLAPVIGMEMLVAARALLCLPLRVDVLSQTLSTLKISSAWTVHGGESTRRQTKISDLPTELLLHIISFLDDVSVLSRAQVKGVLGYASDRTTLSEGAKREGFLRRAGLPVFRRGCGCADGSGEGEAVTEGGGMSGRCKKIKHHLAALEDPVELDADSF